jgi:glycosyltransferase involved in cell wall biosynthesis/cytochrome c-type biogenesis protein CcmH/NrfG
MANTRKLRRIADQARDGKLWQEAAAYYAAYLRQVPHDWPIWVQYGHCLKESGDVEGGLASYHRAFELAPEDSDLNLQIGHALKLLGRIEEALNSYQRAVLLDPRNENAQREASYIQDLLAANKVKLPKETPLASTRGELRQIADQARDGKRWQEAAAHYAAYLQQAPEDWPAWVQRGHCLKDSGDVEGGLASYHRALELAPEDSDLNLQIGHALKLLGRIEQALHSYQHAVSLDHKNAEAKREAAYLQELLAETKAEIAKEAVSRSTRLMFDVSDLIQYIREWRVPSGIQRVQLNVIFFALTEFTALADPIVVYFDQTGSRWVPVKSQLFLALHKAAESGDEIFEEDLQNFLDQLDDPELPKNHLDTQLQKNDVILVNLGSSWWVENYFLKIRELRKQYGIRYVPMIHDVIPLTASKHCAERLVEEFCQWFSTLPFEVDGAVTNSQWSAVDVRHHVSDFLPEVVFPIQPIALNGDMRRDFSSRAVAVKDTIAHLIPAGASFVLCVGTLESRKNHLLLFKAWDRLLAKYDASDVPVLVCLGKAGWLFDEAAEFLRANRLLNSRILLLSSVTDQSLVALYQESLFTLFNSFYEGWGLPVTESLSFGTLPLVACNTSLSEAGGRAAVYFRSDDLDDLHDKLETLIFNAEARKRLSNQARINANLRDWRDIAKEFIETILEIKPSANIRQSVLLRAPIGRIVHLGKSNALKPSLDLAMANLLRDGLNWHRLEDWGSWTTPGTAALRLPLPDEVIGQDLMLFLRFRGTAVDTSITVSCWLDDQRLGAPIEHMIGHGMRHNMAFRLNSRSPHLSLTIDAGAGSSLGPGDRDVGIGVTHLMLCRVDDTAAQHHFMNAFPELCEQAVNGIHANLQRIDIQPS